MVPLKVLQGLQAFKAFLNINNRPESTSNSPGHFCFGEMGADESATLERFLELCNGRNVLEATNTWKQRPIYVVKQKKSANPNV